MSICAGPSSSRFPSVYPKRLLMEGRYSGD
jgi:hypothetical protein